MCAHLHAGGCGGPAGQALAQAFAQASAAGNGAAVGQALAQADATAAQEMRREAMISMNKAQSYLTMHPMQAAYDKLLVLRSVQIPGTASESLQHMHLLAAPQHRRIATLFVMLHVAAPAVPACYTHWAAPSRAQ